MKSQHIFLSLVLLLATVTLGFGQTQFWLDDFEHAYFWAGKGFDESEEPTNNSPSATAFEEIHQSNAFGRQNPFMCI